MNTKPILIDADPGLLVRLSLDLDDDLAILFLLASPEIAILGLTCTYGNSSIARTFADAKALLSHAGRTDLPVLKGAGWRTRDLLRETDASRFLAETVLKRPGEVTVLTLGPLTNLATALTHHPDLAEAIPELVMMGGRLRPGAEFNFGAHPKAADLVLRSAIPKVMVSMELCFQAPLTAAELRRLEDRPNSHLARYLPVIRRWLRLQRFIFSLIRLRYPEIPAGGFFPWDGIAAAYLIDPSLFSEIKVLQVWMENNRTMNSADSAGREPRSLTRAPFRLDAGRFFNLFLGRLVSLKSQPDSLIEN